MKKRMRAIWPFRSIRDFNQEVQIGCCWVRVAGPGIGSDIIFAMGRVAVGGFENRL